jgi:hypothetical protein
MEIAKRTELVEKKVGLKRFGQPTRRRCGVGDPMFGPFNIG